MTDEDQRPLRVLIANERRDEHERLVEVVASLGHVVLTQGPRGDDVASATERERPDVALIGLGDSPGHALDLISAIVRQAACPVIAILHTSESDFVNQAAKRGVFAYLIDGDPSELQNALDIVLRRFAEFQSLEGAFGRRALTERAKGILMERHQVDERKAFEMLRAQSRRSGHKLVDVAEAVTESHLLLPGPASDAASSAEVSRG